MSTVKNYRKSLIKSSKQEAQVKEAVCLPNGAMVGHQLSLLPEFLHERHLISVFDPVAKQQRKKQ